MEIVVNDTNILIDLYNSGLLPYCKRLNLEFRTLDVVMNEIEVPDQQKAIQSIIDDGTLTVFPLSGAQIGTVLQKVAEYQGACNLSVVDISVMVYAIENNCRLLTGDKKLKEKATLEKCESVRHFISHRHAHEGYFYQQHRNDYGVGKTSLFQQPPSK